MRMIISSVVLTITLTAITSAQFTVRLPSIKRPAVEAAKPVSPKSSAAASATRPAAATNRQMVMDDGYTFFDAEPARDAIQRTRVILTSAGF